MHRKRQGKLNLSPRKRRLPESEHGDWRVPLEHPEEVEHYVNPPLTMWRRMHLRVEYLQSAETAEWLRAAEADEGWEPIHGWPKLLRRMLAVGVLLPLSVVMVFALLVQLYHAAPTMESFTFWLSEPVWFSLMGAMVMAALKFSVIADNLLVYAYVLGHELTHAIAAKMCGGHLQAISIDRDGGYVETDADNLFIALSPYFVPLWMLCWLGVLWLAHWIYPFDAFAPWFYAGFGFWWAFHLYWTVWIIPREQPDMLSNGVMFSLLLVLLMNIVALLAVLWSFGVLSLSGYWADLQFCTKEIIDLFADVLGYAWQVFRSMTA